MAKTRDRILAFLQEFGPQTKRELAEGLEMTMDAVNASITCARAKGLLYVHSWRRNSMDGQGNGVRGKPSPVLAVGPGKDAPPLKPIPSIVRKRAYRRRMAPIIDARVSNNARGPFEIMINHLQDRAC